MKKLTSKQCLFVQALLEGLNQKQAYLKAYPKAARWKDKTVRNKASELIRVPIVWEEYNRRKEELEAEFVKEQVWTRNRAVNGLLWIMEVAEQQISEKGLTKVTSDTYLNAMKELNEIEGIGEERRSKIRLHDVRIEKLQSEMKSGGQTEEKLSEFFATLQKEVINDEQIK